ncbi:DUF3883 domain-containing protein, partial [Sphingobacterium hotanense]|uniref:DUF3883 domain-containing protein n=1 Tax=Sphingobacterium hotanense TaxID=649196 RepID=UPI0021A29EEC
MIVYISQVAPQAVKELFCLLSDEELDLVNRLVKFQSGIAEISETHFPKRNPYQDYRAILVYLTMRFPDRYIFFKFSMFKTFASDLEYPFMPSRGNIDNITRYITFCNLLKAEIVKDKELLLMHSSRLTSREYIDNSFNILTQDIVFSVTRFRNNFAHLDHDSDILNKLNLITKRLKPGLIKTKLEGSFTNYLQNEQERKRIGTLGELLVIRYEEEKLMDWKIKKKPEHISVTKGDGLGYDNLSYDKCGKPIYIEVKTTTGNFDTTFFVTRNELEGSIRNSDCYFLYRLFNYEPLINYADFVMRKGNLSDL